MGKMKKVRIYESEIKRAVRRKLMENVLLENSTVTDELEKRTAATKELTAAQKELAQVQKDMADAISEEFEMKDTYSRKKYRQSPRERDIESVFGQYSEEIPPSVLRYMRKNPEKIVKRLYDIYGQQMFDYISPNLKDNPQYEVSIDDIVSEDKDWIQSAIKKPGSLSKELGVPEEDNIPSSLINKEINKLKEKDKDPKKKGIQGLSKRNLSKFRKLNLAKTLKNL